MKTAIWTLLALAVPLTAPFAASAQVNSDEAAMKRFIEALRIVEDNAADPVDTETAFSRKTRPGIFFNEAVAAPLSSARASKGRLISASPEQT